MPAWLRAVLESIEALSLDDARDRETLGKRIMAAVARRARELDEASPVGRALASAQERA